jgi:hypothetical protein
MNLHQSQKRRTRSVKLDVESLDARIVPATIHPSIAAAAGVTGAPAATNTDLPDTDSATASAHIQARREKLLARRIEKQDRAMERAENRLARQDARSLARHPRAATVASHAIVSPSATGPPAAVTVSADNLRAATSSSPINVVKTPSANSVTAPSANSTMASSGNSTGTTGVTQSGTTTGSQTVSSLPPNAAQTLSVIYSEFEQDPTGFSGPTTSANGANLVVIQGDNVGIQVHDGNPADFNTLVTELQSMGMQITTSDATYGTVVGMLPIAQLPAVATLSQTPSVTPLMQPITN